MEENPKAKLILCAHSVHALKIYGINITSIYCNLDELDLLTSLLLQVPLTDNSEMLILYHRLC